MFLSSQLTLELFKTVPFANGALAFWLTQGKQHPPENEEDYILQKNYSRKTENANEQLFGHHSYF